MELPVLYALSYPDRLADTGVPPFDPVELSPLTFEKVRSREFPALDLGVQAGRDPLGWHAEGVEEPGSRDPLRGQVKEAELAGLGLGHRRGALRGAHLAVDTGPRDAQLVEARDLVDHQGDQG